MLQKKLFTLLLFSLFFQFTFAQIKSQLTFLGGHVSYYNTTTKYSHQPDSKNKGALFNLSLGKVFKENNIVGLILDIPQTKEKIITIPQI